MPMKRTRRPVVGGFLAAQRDAGLRIEALARNLWWTWNPDPQRLFAGLDPVQWEATNHNPIRTYALMPAERRAMLAGDRDFLALLRDCERQLAEYLRARTWFQRHATAAQKRTRIAYFCAEYGLHESLPVYAGGLGVLAGDHLKSTSDLGIPLVAVGLLYRSGYYTQELRRDGSTRVRYPQLDARHLPVIDTGRVLTLPIGGRAVRVRIWRVQIGRVPLFLLDTDMPANAPRDRAITQHLYGGDQETRIQQEVLLGVGGVRALDALGIKPTVFHLNEGHAAFCALERLRQARVDGVELGAGVDLVRNTTVFTTHTPVPAGHDRFAVRLMKKYLGEPMAVISDQERDVWLTLGQEDPFNRKQEFCMTVLAIHLSARRNGVSELHGEVTRQMWTRVFNETNPRKVPIGSITNGIHSQTWLAPEMRPLYDKYLKPRWVGAGPEDDWWRRADRIPAGEFWHARGLLRRKLVEFIRARLREQILRRCEPVQELVASLETFDENALTIGFARRFATYKRAPLIFHDARRLAAILGNAKQPVQIVFAGKAHPADAEGQRFAQQVYLNARKAGFRGRVVLLENYDMHVGRMLTAGCDVWLNNPLRPQEASGTSGMKPPLHGGLNCSILDGWWPEAYNGRNGWAIEGEATKVARSNARIRRATQDRRDAEAIYRLLEREIIPLFYTRDRRGIPQGWVRRMVASMKTVCGQFNTHRMLAEYLELYAPAER